MNVKHPLLLLFLRSLVISATTVGGGYVILSALRRLYVDKLGWIREEEMADLAAVAQSAPGAVAVNASLLVGYRLRGIGGALVSLAGCVIPPLFVMCLLAEAYRRADGLPLAARLLGGMRAGVAAVILDTALTMTKSALREDTAARGAVFVCAAALCFLTDLSPAWVILAAAAVGGTRGILFLRRRRAGRTE